jgi:hypothetical protein
MTCPSCVFQEVRKCKRDALLPGILGSDDDRYVINVETELMEGNSWAYKRLTDNC